MKAKIPYSTGYRAEREAFKILEQEGYLAYRSAGSHGLFDLIGVSPDDVRLIQIKVIGYNEKRIFLKERQVIKSLATPLFCRKELWVYEKRRGWHYYIC